MKCEIIRDLLPLYLDRLTSEESNQAILEHLDGCEPCKEILGQMQEEMETKTEETKKKINPFRKFNRKMKAYVGVTLAVCIAVGGFGYKAFGQGFAIDPNEITMEPTLDGDMLYLNFAVEDGVLVHSASMYDNTSASIDLRKAWALPGDSEEQASNEFSWGMSLKMLKVGIGERMELQLKDGALAEVETSNNHSVTINNKNGTPSAAVMFQEGDSATAVVIGGESKFDVDEYTVNIDYGNETASYTLKELIEMAQK